MVSMDTSASQPHRGGGSRGRDGRVAPPGWAGRLALAAGAFVVAVRRCGVFVAEPQAFNGAVRGS